MKSESIRTGHRAISSGHLVAIAYWLVAFLVSRVVISVWLPQASETATVLQTICLWAAAAGGATSVLIVLSALGLIHHGENYYPAALRSSRPARFGAYLVCSTVLGATGINYFIWQMSAPEKYLASRLSHKMATTVESVRCSQVHQGVRSCDVKFNGDLDVIPKQTVEFPSSDTDHPEAYISLSHDMDVGSSGPIEHNLRVKTSIDTSTVDSKEALAWILKIQDTAVAAAHQQAIAWLESEEKARNAANSYH